MLSPALHRSPDPERSRDPRIRALVGQLRTLEGAPAPRPEFRDELRTQLVAITPRIVEEGERPARRRPSPGAAARVPEATAKGEKARSRRRIHLARPLAVITSVIAVFALLLGGAVWISQRALPGDALYGLKRASERVQQSLTSGDKDRAKLSLDLALTRYDETRALLPDAKTSKQPSGHTLSLVKSTLSSADSDLRTAMLALSAQALKDNSGSDYTVVASWAKSPVTDLATKAGYLPKGATLNRMVSSWTLLVSAQKQAARVAALGDCGCITRLPHNSLGVFVPKGGVPRAAPPTTQPTSTQTGGGQSANPSGPATTAPAGGGPSAGTSPAEPAPSSSTAPSSADPGSSTAGGLGIPLLPSSSGSSCDGLDLGLISVGPCAIRIGGDGGTPSG